MRAPPRHWPILAILLVAAALRLWRLDAVPPGFQFDEAHNAIDAARVLDGQPAIFFPDNGGREPLSIYLDAISLAIVGRDRPALAVRLVSALVGILTVAVVYRLYERLFADRRVALLAAAFLAVSYWHLHFSRYGIRAILAPLWTAAAIWAWWAAVGGEGVHAPGRAADEVGTPAAGRWARLSEAARRVGPDGFAALAGVLMAAGVYSHPSGRLVPLALLGHALFRTAARRGAARTWRALFLAGATALVAFAPLGWHFVLHPEQFFAHPSDVSLAAVAQDQYGGSIVQALGAHLAAVVGMFFVAGDPSTFHNLPGLPVFDPLSALLATGGGALLLASLLQGQGERRDRSVLLVLWLLVMLSPTVLSDRPPNYSRAIASLPVVVLLPALGLRQLLDAMRKRAASFAPFEPAVAAVALVVAGGWTVANYLAFSRLPHAYYSYDVEKIDAYRELERLSADADVFLAPVWAEHATIGYLNRDGPIRSLDASDTLVLPGDGRDAVVAFPAKEAEKEGTLDAAESLFGRAAERRDIVDAQGAPLLVTFRVPGAARGDLEPPTDAPLEPEAWTAAIFGGQISLLGYTAGAARPGEPLPITLVWRALEPVSRDLTVFVHLVGPGGRPLGQLDREPGKASYRTSAWQPGDVVIDRYAPVLAADAAGPVTPMIGWYDARTGERLGVGEEDVFRLKPIEPAQ